jgi:hypothetical protein
MIPQIFYNILRQPIELHVTEVIMGVITCPPKFAHVPTCYLSTRGGSVESVRDHPAEASICAVNSPALTSVTCELPAHLLLKAISFLRCQHYDDFQAEHENLVCFFLVHEASAVGDLVS